MSKRAPSSKFAVLCCISSPVSGCSSSSTHTLWQTSVSSEAVMSLMSLCLSVGRPPREQLKACSTVRFFPHTQWEGKCDSCQPYLRHNASLKAPLCTLKPCSTKGIIHSQPDVPFSLQKSITRCRSCGSFSHRLSASFCCCWCL